MDRRSKRKKLKKIAKSKKKLSVSTERELSDQEIVDLEEDIQPIEHYVHDREEMINQVFSVMEKEKLETIIPPILKGMVIKELKEKCLNVLKEMSIEEIYRVLRGEPAKLPFKGEQVNSVLSTSKSPDKDSDVAGKGSPSCSKQDIEEPESQTLLDILEQEMQRIAYETVLCQGNQSSLTSEIPNSDRTSPVSSDGVQVISPSSSSVELVCLDSTDNSCDEAAVTSKGSVLSEEPLTNATHELASEHESDTVVHILQNSASDPVKMVDVANIEDSSEKSTVANKSTSSDMTNNFEITSPKLSCDVESGHSKAVQSGDPACVETSEDLDVILPRGESFMVQVFSGKSASSERVVKKVLRCSEVRTSNSDREWPTADKRGMSVSVKENNVSPSPVSPLNGVLTSANKSTDSFVNSDITSSSVMLPSPNCNISKNLSSEQVCEVHACEDSSGIIRDCIVNDQCDVQEVGEATNVEDCETTKIVSSDLIEHAEKEEGEITEEESEDDIELVEVVRDTYQSPTILLSSDENRESSDDNNPNKCLRRHRHHRRRRHKRGNSPETSGRLIEKRGNRSYRRKKCLVSEGLSNNDVENCRSVMEDDESLGVPPVTSSTQEPEFLPHGSNSDQSDNKKIDAPDSIVNSEVDRNQNNSSHCSSSDDADSVFDVSDNPEEETGLPKDRSEAASLKASWVDRWAEKKDLKRVVITSKIYTNVRKKILSEKHKKKRKESSHEVELPSVPPLVLHVEGSVQEYQMLQWMSSEPLDKDAANVENTQCILAPQLENLDSLCTLPKSGEIVSNLSSPSNNTNKSVLSVELDSSYAAQDEVAKSCEMDMENADISCATHDPK